jgi:uncharacterized membrane-anchored protein
VRSKLFILGFLVLMVWINFQVYQREREIAVGRTLILKLAPLDPRSLMQGDYMRLRYDIANQVPTEPAKGVVYLNPDDRGLATTASTTKSPGSIPLLYRRHRYQVKFGVDTFLFQEGMAKEYDRAKYAELKVTEKGGATLLQLLDENFTPIGAD